MAGDPPTHEPTRAGGRAPGRETSSDRHRRDTTGSPSRHVPRGTLCPLALTPGGNRMPLLVAVIDLAAVLLAWRDELREVRPR
jgi:hypothetical protein